MAKSETASGTARAHRRLGWTGLFVWMAFGYTLEILHGFKTHTYLADELRREMWTLAHFHGALLSLLNLVYVHWADASYLPARARRLASRLLLAGSVLLPLGFLLGGVAHFEGDPGFGIMLAPLGGILLLTAVGRHAVGVWRK